MTSPVPDVLALELTPARALLEAAGWEVAVRTTSPPRRGEGEGTQRVVRQRICAPGCVELVVACPRFVRAASGS